MYNIRYNVLNKVHEARRAAAVEDPVELLSPRRRPRACPRLAKGITGRRASGHWKGFVTRAMAMARWDAIVPSHGTRTMRNSDRFANKANGSCSPLSPQESSGGTAWFHQEDAQDSRPGFRVGTKAKGGT